VKKLVIGLLDRIGLGSPARRIKAEVDRRLRAWGFAAWDPLVPEDRFYLSCREAIRTIRSAGPDEPVGHYLEFGVSRGTSLACMHRALVDEGLSQTRLIGFDSFEGLPAEASREGWNPGAFQSSLSATRRYLGKAGVDWARVTLVKGWFKDTLKPGNIRGIDKASFIMIDCDIYSASKDALWFCEPLIRGHAVVFFDDWAAGPVLERPGQREVMQEFLAAFPRISAQPLPSYAAAARVFLLTRQSS